MGNAVAGSKALTQALEPTNLTARKDVSQAAPLAWFGMGCANPSGE